MNSRQAFRAVFFSVTAFVAGVEGCAETDEAPGKALDAGSSTLDASTDSGGGVDSSTLDTGAIDAGPADTGLVDAHDAAVDVHDAGPCPIGIDDTVSASFKVTADDYLTAYVNGVLVGDKTTTWGTVDTYAITLFRHPSRKNVIAVEAKNAANQGGLDRGLLGEITFDTDAGAGAQLVVTDTAWKLGTAPDGGLPDGSAADAGTPGWFGLAFDDTSWVTPVDEGAHGIAPWGSVFGTSTAHWLWSYDSAAAVSKPATESIYVRRTIYLDISGAVSASATSCP